MFPQGDQAHEQDMFFLPHHAQIEVGGVLQNVACAKKQRSPSCWHPICEPDAVFEDGKVTSKLVPEMFPAEIVEKEINAGEPVITEY